MQCHIFTEFSNEQKVIFDQNTKLIYVLGASQKATELMGRVGE